MYQKSQYMYNNNNVIDNKITIVIALFIFDANYVKCLINRG